MLYLLAFVIIACASASFAMGAPDRLVAIGGWVAFGVGALGMLGSLYELKDQDRMTDAQEPTNEATMAIPLFYVTGYDSMGQRRLTACEQVPNHFTIHEYAPDGTTLETSVQGSLGDVVNLYKELHCSFLIAAPQPAPVATAFTNRFAKLLQGNAN